MSINYLFSENNPLASSMNPSFNNLNIMGTFTFDGVQQNPQGITGAHGSTGITGPTGPIGPTGMLPPISGATGAILYDDGSGNIIAATNAIYVDNETSLTIIKPSSQATLSTVLNLGSDLSGSHGWGSFIRLFGNPQGGATIWRDDNGLYASTLQIFGADYAGLSGSCIYLNGNNSTEAGAGDAGSFQCVIGYDNISGTGGSYQVLGRQPNYNILFKIFDNNNGGQYYLPGLSASSYVGVDANHNLISLSGITGNTGPMGNTGATGSIGNTGATGSTNFPSTIYANTYLTASASTTTITSISTPVPINNTFSNNVLSNFTNTSGVLQYIGTSSINVIINANISCQDASVATDEIILTCVKNGSSNLGSYGGATITNLGFSDVSLAIISTLNHNDTIQLYLQNQTSTNSIITKYGSFTVHQI
jgi:hypothetical protein